MKVSVEIGYIDENGLDENLLKKVVCQIVGNMNDKVKEIIQNELDNQFSKQVDDYLQKILLDFTNRNIVITDRYGDEVQRYENAREMLKERFDNFISEEVDEKGKLIKRGGSKTCYAKRGNPRIENIMKKLIPSASYIEKEVIASVKKEVDIIIKKAKEKAATDTIQFIMSKIDIDAAVGHKK